MVDLKRPLRTLMRPSLRERLPPLERAWTWLGRRRELRFWKKALADGRLAGKSREPFFTTHVGLDRAFYEGKRILDIGCGPRGELDWAEMAAERVGLDPLADRYLELRGEDAGRRMTYVNGVAERIPFPDASFDVVSSINSLDHVQDVARVAAEIKRVLRLGGTFLLVTELNHRARLTEPQVFSWDVLDHFAPEMELVHERRIEDSGRGIDASVEEAVPYDDTRSPHPGVLLARLELRTVPRLEVMRERARSALPPPDRPARPRPPTRRRRRAPRTSAP
jgi:SAM-dependent methyltransferase